MTLFLLSGAENQWLFGSGCDSAFTATDCGLNARDAVMMSAKRDVNTGGKIRTFKVNRKNKVT